MIRLARRQWYDQALWRRYVKKSLLLALYSQGYRIYIRIPIKFARRLRRGGEWRPAQRRSARTIPMQRSLGQRPVGLTRASTTGSISG